MKYKWLVKLKNKNFNTQFHSLETEVYDLELVCEESQKIYPGYFAYQIDLLNYEELNNE